MVRKAFVPPIEIVDVPPRFKTRRLRESRIRRKYQQFRHLPDEWETADHACDCYLTKERAHSMIVVKIGSKRYRICPVRYYIFCAWKAVWVGDPPPSEELYWELLGHGRMQREEPV